MSDLREQAKRERDWRKARLAFSAGNQAAFARLSDPAKILFVITVTLSLNSPLRSVDHDEAQRVWAEVTGAPEPVYVLSYREIIAWLLDKHDVSKKIRSDNV